MEHLAVENRALDSSGFAKELADVSTQELKEITAEWNVITQLPPELAKFKSLHTLSAYCNQIETLPQFLFSMKALTRIFLSKNNIKHVPEEIGSLTNLEELNLSVNQISELPASMSDLKKLRILTLTKNNFAKIPEVVFEITSLAELEINANAIKVIPDTILQLSNLTALSVAQTELHSLPEALGTLSKLKVFDAHLNYINTLPESFVKLQCLQDVKLQSNDLSTFPKALQSLPLLNSLSIGNNPVSFKEEATAMTTSKPTMFIFYNDDIVDEIVPGLYLGSLDGSANRHFLTGKVKNVLSALNINFIKPYYPDLFTYTLIDANDTDAQDLISLFEDTYAMIEKGINDGGILVHCQAGRSRSATLVAAYLMKKMNKTPDEALDFITERRPIVCPNNGFRSQLRKYGREVLGMEISEPPPPIRYNQPKPEPVQERRCTIC